MRRGIGLLLFVLVATVVLMAQYGDGHKHHHKHSHSSKSHTHGPHHHKHTHGHHTHGKHTHGKHTHGHHTHGKHTHGPPHHKHTHGHHTHDHTSKSKDHTDTTDRTDDRTGTDTNTGNTGGGNTPVVYVYHDCQDAYNNGHIASGLYTINPDGKTSFQVYCDMETDGGGWTVFQRRVDVSVDFYLNWKNYEIGFGNLLGDLWLGLSKLYRLANSFTPQELRVDLIDFSSHRAYAKYHSFFISDAASDYELFVGGYSGNAGDAMSAHYGAKFSTKDQDHDQVGSNCAQQNHAGWWFKSCSYQSSLNGEYLSGGVTSFKGIVWAKWKNSMESCKSAEMKIRPTTKATQ